MSDVNYRGWLEEQGYGPNTVATQTSLKKRLEEAYGSLDLAAIDELLTALRYSADDARARRPDPSKLRIGGDLVKGLASFRSALRYYARFLSSGTTAAGPLTEADTADQADPEYRQRIGLERDLQTWLRRSIGDVEAGLDIVDDGVERAVASGFIDITARDADGVLAVFELKADVADRNAVGQILSYMGDLQEDEGGPVRGILVAHDFTEKARAAARMVPSLTLRKYAVRFVIEP